MQSLAVDVSLAALLGDKVYSFGELLLHPIVRPLLYSCPHVLCVKDAALALSVSAFEGEFRFG